MQIKIIGILGAAVILMGVTVGLLVKRLDTVRNERDQAIEFNLVAQDSVEYFKNAWGRESSRAVVLDLTLRNVQRLRSDERLAWVRQFESVNKRLNNLESATRTVARAVGTFTVPLVPDPVPWDTTGAFWYNDSTWITLDHDTSFAIRDPLEENWTVFPPMKFSTNDKWVDIRGTLYGKDSVTIDFDVNVPVESVVVFERKKVLGLRIGRKQWFTETASPNPYVKITESTVIRVGKRKRK